jgi:20S proteasome alpha/beta subunit
MILPKPLPKPLPHPKPKRLLKGRKPMTLIAGFRCTDGGILMCADREESGDGTKRSVDKLKELRLADADFVFAASGSAIIVTNLYQRLEEALRANEDDLLASHVSVISGVLRSIHKEFREFKEWEELVIAAAFYQDTTIPIASFLYSTYGNYLRPEQHFVCKGGGKDLAGYFFHRLFNPWPDRRRSVIVAAFVFREVEDHVEGVGRGTDIKYMATHKRLIQTVPHGDVKALEDAIPSIKDVLFERWHQGITIPSWLKANLYEGESEL